VFHRPQTANGIATPDLLYNAATTPEQAKGARDIVLRLDGTTKPYDVTEFATGTAANPSKWQSQDYQLTLRESVPPSGR
jgi:hypothetical protein